MNKETKKRVVMLVGAGASCDFGIALTSDLTLEIKNWLNKLPDEENENIVGIRYGELYNNIQDVLKEYYKSTEQAHFERIYHVTTEAFNYLHAKKYPVRYNDIKPVLFPFLNFDKIDSLILRKEKQFLSEDEKDTKETHILFEIARKIEYCISQYMIKKCQFINGDKASQFRQHLDSFSSFISNISKKYIPRIYTTNYDNIILQAYNQANIQFNTGFSEKIESANSKYLKFSPYSIVDNWDKPGLFHLHGSIHLGFWKEKFDSFACYDEPQEILAWYDDPKDALKTLDRMTGYHVKQDGSIFFNRTLITGLSKLDRLQYQPYLSYYTNLYRELLEADLIIVAGVGMMDLHLNSYLQTVTKFKKETPILFVTYRNPDPKFQFNNVDSELLHTLHIDVFGNNFELVEKNGWLKQSNNRALWYGGFAKFLKEGYQQYIDSPENFWNVSNP
jgi:hypothetical protein